MQSRRVFGHVCAGCWASSRSAPSRSSRYPATSNIAALNHLLLQTTSCGTFRLDGHCEPSRRDSNSRSSSASDVLVKHVSCRALAKRAYDTICSSNNGLFAGKGREVSRGHGSEGDKGSGRHRNAAGRGCPPFGGPQQRQQLHGSIFLLQTQQVRALKPYLNDQPCPSKVMYHLGAHEVWARPGTRTVSFPSAQPWTQQSPIPGRDPDCITDPETTCVSLPNFVESQIYLPASQVPSDIEPKLTCCHPDPHTGHIEAFSYPCAGLPAASGSLRPAQQ